MSQAAPLQPPGAMPPTRRTDGVAGTVLTLAIMFLLAGAIAVASGAYILSAELHSPRGEPIFWAGVAGLATGAVLAWVARLQ